MLELFILVTLTKKIVNNSSSTHLLMDLLLEINQDKRTLLKLLILLLMPKNYNKVIMLMEYCYWRTMRNDLLSVKSLSFNYYILKYFIMII
jgi:hypothetical protein